ncbi:GPI inositol-deacylase [Mactra antiquata]
MAGTKTLIFSVFVVVLIVIGITDVLINYEQNQCEMTWMFERPEYVPVPLSKAVKKKFPNYGLYVYGEGKYASILGDMKMIGVPVLFIHGNAGSYKQARSIGSVAFRRVIDKGRKFHFNVFTVDLNEEFSGLHGTFLKQQTEFVNVAIKKIFSLYKNPEFQPSTIVLVGHSMGGMIARALFTLPGFDAKSVNTIYMQSTPNQHPVVVLDSEVSEFFNKVNTYWRDNNNSTLRHVTLVSMDGGDLDVQVRAGLTPLNDLVQDSRAVSISTTHMPKAWVPTDHRCIVWCKQVVLGIVRSLFDIMDQKTKVIRDDPDYRMEVFKHHFLQHDGPVGYKHEWPSQIVLNKKTKWHTVKDQAFKWENDNLKEDIYVAVPVGDFDDVDTAVIVANVVHDSWVCVCELKEGEDRCTTCRDISSTGNMLPPLYSNKKVVSIDLEADDMATITHVVVLVSPLETTQQRKVEVTGEVYRQDVRHLSNSLPGLMEVIMSYPESITKGTMVLDLGRASFYKLKLYNLNHVAKVYSVKLETSKCTQPVPGDSSGTVMRFHVPWGNNDVYKHFEYGKSGNISLKVQYIPPTPTITPYDPDFQFDALPLENDYVELFVHLDPTCAYKLRITMSFKEMLGQFVRFYGILMPAFCVAVLLMTLVHQLRTISKDGVCPSVLDSIWEIKPYFVVPIALVIQWLLQLKVIEKKLSGLGLPSPDSATMDKMGIWFRGAQLSLYFLALAITTFHALVVSLVVQFNSRLLGLIFGWLPSSLYKVWNIIVIILCLLSVGLSATICGTIGIFICYITGLCQVLILCYQGRQTKDPGTQSKFHLYQTLFMIWMWLLMLNSPPLVVLVKSIESTGVIPILQNDTSRIVGTLSSLAFIFIQLSSSTFTNRSSLRQVSYIIHILVIMIVVFGMVMLYRVSYVICTSLVILAIVQVIDTVRTRSAPRPKTE